MLDRKSSSRKVDETVARSVDFEVTIADIARRSERRAWWVAFSAIGMALILAGGYFYMLPLKQKVPYLVMADAYTGTSTVARLNDDSAMRKITASEAINRSNVAHYVLARESYDVALMNLRDWVTTLTMSSPAIAAAYRSLYSPNNPANPYKTYGKDKAIRVKILSIVLLGGDSGKTPTGATVRFQRTLYDKQNGGSQPLDNKIATLVFTYKPDLQMDDRYRIENPLGFQVTDYRVDNDYDSAPPAEAPAQTTLGGNANANPGMQAPAAAATSALPGSTTQPPMPEHEPAPSQPLSAASSAFPGKTANGVGHR